MNRTARFVPVGSGKKHTFAGVEVLIKAFKGETDHHWSMMEYTAPAGFAGPGLHYHKIMEEGFYVLDGTLTFTLSDGKIEAGAGSLVTVPPYAVHAFSNPSEHPAHFLVFMSPGGFEGYYDELLLLMQSEPTWPPRDKGQLEELLRRYDTFPVTW